MLFGASLIAEHPFSLVYTMHLPTLQHKERPNPKCLILFSGTPGMGKTTIAKELEERFQAIRLSTDEARDFLRKNNLPLSLADSYIEWCLQKVAEELPNHLIILDRSVDRTYETYRQFASLYGYETFLIRMDVERSIVEERIEHRGRDAEELLQKLDRSWHDFLLFGQTYTPDFHFKNNAKLDEPLAELVSILSQKIENKLPLKRLRKGSKEWERVRESIMHASSLCDPQADMHEVIPGLYFGNQKAADAAPDMISHVLTCRSTPERKFPIRITWKGISFADSVQSNVLPFFDETYDFIDHTSEGVLVHCREGVSRSATIVIAYLMKKFDLPMDVAYQYVKKRRPVAEPNDGFKKQLKTYEKQLQS
jgi:protein-tyrosine phosphatase/predicted kinase